MPLEGAKLRKGSSALMRHSMAQPSTVGLCCESLGSCTGFLACFRYQNRVQASPQTWS